MMGGGIPFAGQFQGQLGGGIPFGGQFNGQLGGQGFPPQNIGGQLSDFNQVGANNFNLPPCPPPPMPPKKKSILPWVLGGGALALLLLANKSKTVKTTKTGGTADHEGGEADG
jgi:hypothetical protein